MSLPLSDLDISDRLAVLFGVVLLTVLWVVGMMFLANHVRFMRSVRLIQGEARNAPAKFEILDSTTHVTALAVGSSTENPALWPARK